MGNFQAAMERFGLSPVRLSTILVLCCIVLLITLIQSSSKFSLSELESAQNVAANQVLNGSVESAQNVAANQVLNGSVESAQNVAANQVLNGSVESAQNVAANQVLNGSVESAQNVAANQVLNGSVESAQNVAANQVLNGSVESAQNVAANQVLNGSVESAQNVAANQVLNGSVESAQNVAANQVLNGSVESAQNVAANQVLNGSVQSFKSGPDNNSLNSTSILSRNDSLQSVRSSGDKLLHGLLASGFDESSCLSRYQSYLFRKDSPHKPSQYLISKLRNYEDLHRRCGPHTKSYNRTVKMIRKKFSRNHINGSAMCKYIVWIPNNGLGNRIVSIVSTFLYAVLTNRVLLVGFGTEMTGLFCEPFPNSSWLLSTDFPYRDHHTKLQDYERIIEGNIAKNSTGISASTMFLDLERDHSKIFHCDYTQAMIQQVPALILMSDQYFAPSLFMMTSLKNELNKMFPQKEIVFHHLGRYLFHPSNEAWGLISRFYKSYLTRADERIGLQIRVFNTKLTPYQTLMDQILSCTQKHKLLPELDQTKTISPPSKNQTSKSVFVASLHSEYAENLRTMYWTKPTVTGETVGVYQASHEEVQKFHNNEQNMKAWSEMYLLSLCDVLVTTGVSTFGYVAQSLGGLKPWILYKTLGNHTRDPPCEHAFSMEPCFHFPPSYDCKANTKADFTSQFPFMKPCEDRRSGVKMIDDQL